MRPYHQGQLDFFCAAYAVINALDYLYSMPLARSRDIFASTLEDLAAQPRLWQATLRNRTDFYWLPPYMLTRVRSRYALSLSGIQPFPGQLFRPGDMGTDPLEPDCLDLEKVDHIRPAYDCNGMERDQVWDLIREWFSEKSDTRCMLLRFRRYLPYSDEPIVQHWTAADAMRGEELLFRDASRDPGAIFSLRRDCTDISARKGIRKQLLVLEPPSILFLERTA